jgi:hypothetical protein
LVLIALSILTLLGLSLSFNGITESKISDNFEAETKALMLAEAGLNRAINELRGQNFSHILKGPNNRADTSVRQASTFDFRNPIPLKGSIDPRSLNINDSSQVTNATVNDDGIIPSIGRLGVRYLIRKGPDGILGTADDLAYFENETVLTSDDAPIGRYFVKVTNNPEDPGGPFTDTDNILVIRSMGLIKANPGEVPNSGGGNARNAMAIIETRVRIDMTFKTNSPFTVAGTGVAPAGNRFFDGNAYGLDGGSHLGISVINTTGTNTDPVNEPMTQALSNAPFAGHTRGGGLSPSIRNITGNVLSGRTWSGTPNPDVSHLMSAAYVSNFITKAANYADVTYNSDVGSAAYQGTDTNPQFVYVNSNLMVTGGAFGAGLLIVTGALSIRGNSTFHGVILVIGPNASVDIRGNPIINGGLYTSTISTVGRAPTYGTAQFTLQGRVSGSSRYMSMAFSLLPMVQIQWREIHPEMEP